MVLSVPRTKPHSMRFIALRYTSRVLCFEGQLNFTSEIIEYNMYAIYCFHQLPHNGLFLNVWRDSDSGVFVPSSANAAKPEASKVPGTLPVNPRGTTHSKVLRFSCDVDSSLDPQRRKSVKDKTYECSWRPFIRRRRCWLLSFASHGRTGRATTHQVKAKIGKGAWWNDFLLSSN